MKMEEIYREFIELTKLPDNETKEKAMEEFFRKLNTMQLPEYFNWAEEIFEGVHVKDRGNQKALIWSNIETGEKKEYTYEQFAAEGNRIVNFLRGHGVEKGDSFYMMIPLLPPIWFATFATVKGGFIGVPTATTMTVRDLEYRFKVYPPVAIMADEASAKTIDEALSNVGAEPKVKIVIGDRSGWESYDSLSKESSEAEAAKTKWDDIIFSFFTSGTTGLPKRVAHTATSYPVGHLMTACIINVQPGDIHHNLSAPGWAKYAWSSFFAPLNVGATATGFYYTRLNGDLYLQAVSEFKVNTFCAPPTAWRLFMFADIGKYDYSALRDVVSAGEPLNPELYEQWKKYTDTEIRDFYGQTESTAMIGNPPWFKGGKIIPGSFGRPTFMYDVTLVDDEGNEITKPNEVGHIVVRLDRWRPIGLFKEYMGDPEKTAKVFVGKYYYTGDKAFFDEKGYWWFVGRADDVIKTSDYRVGPFEVESALIEHPAVAEAAVVGSPHPIRYQLVKAFVILAPGYEPSRELALELFMHCKNILARYKIPRIIEFVPELPKTISGKIRRVELRQIEEEKRKKGEKGEHEYFYDDFPELKSS
ncbi:acyl-CoA synthetase [Archaeoglobus fulgidus]|uniref:Acetyl-CoA synthetase (Acs-6) n=2 Tax=Archaeoglobus fulgidus TaxID=2234 RepID=O28981_ARCFU|nr:AMP-binding protein [Archaeoglobus fulgidus]AAB89958.1 acetyl-CoA synthetase (acs-6) [Archaeoglobus fulgidus DSM 4304]